MTVHRVLALSGYAQLELCLARFCTEEEKANFAEWCRDEMMFAVSGSHIGLPHLYFPDLRDFLGHRISNGMFPGVASQVWIINKEEWDAILAMEQAAAEKQAEEGRESLITALLERKRLAERQMKDGKLPDKDEAERKAKRWNDTYNEGGEGYVPHFFTTEEYGEICKQLEELGA